MNPDETGGPTATSIPGEVGQESPNPLPDQARPERRPDAEAERKHTEQQLDHGLEQTFPASDPVSIQTDR